jgi:heme-degrading monooxygenase HmoA
MVTTARNFRLTSVYTVNGKEDPAMIMRVWRGRVPAEKGDAYLEMLQRTGLPEYAHTPGNKGVWCFRKDHDNVAEFLLATRWESVEAIKRFAGEDYERAKYYPEDDTFLLEKEPFARHFECDAA